MYLTAADIGQRLQIPTKQIYELAKSRKIPGVKIGKYWRFEEAKVWRHIERVYGNGGF